jgi:crotonobetainyl-CoA:carnitine CoA-transferase CaiB-like acyl-CoA transferase
MGDGSERNPYFRYINRNKKSLTLDYKAPRGKEIFFKLVSGMDVLVENYRPTVMDRAGLGYDVLREKHPRLIYAQLSGFGSDGPYRERGGFDLIAQGMGGIMHVTGEPDGPPTSVGLPICDLGTGMWGAQGVLAALYERQRTGQGQKVECSLLETAVGFSSWTSWVDVSVADQNGQPVAGATVTFAVSGGTTTTRSCTTAANGTCSTVDSKVSMSKSKKSVTYTTINLAKAGATWDGARWAVTLQLR